MPAERALVSGLQMNSPTTWSPHRTKSLDHVSRVLCNVYLDGSTDENGPLVVYPRRVTDPWLPASPHKHTEQGWSKRQVVYMPPGSACIFDACLFHYARPPAATSGLRRYIFGGHYTGWHNRRRHREDNFHQISSTREMVALEKRYPRLFLPRPTLNGETEESVAEELQAVARM